MTAGFICMTDLDKDDIQNHPPFKRNCKGEFLCEFYDADQKLVNRQIFDGKPTRDFYDSGEVIIGQHLGDEKETKKSKSKDMQIGILSLPSTATTGKISTSIPSPSAIAKLRIKQD